MGNHLSITETASRAEDSPGSAAAKTITKDEWQNFCEKFAHTAEQFPEQVAIEVQRAHGSERISYRELRRRAEAAAGFLNRRGVASGDRCAILADNDIAWCAAYLGILRLGAVAVPLDVHYLPQQVATLLRDSGAKILFTTQRYLATSREAQRVSAAGIDLVLLEGAASDAGSLEDVPRESDVGLPVCTATREDAAVILYTSGTTSDPKGVVLTHGNLLAEANAAFQVVQVDENDSILGVLPLFHSLAQMANLLLPFAAGARVIYLEELNTTGMLRALREQRPTLFCCVPKFFYLIHERVLAEAAKRGRLRWILFRWLLRGNGGLRRHLGLNLGKLLFRPVHGIFGGKMRLLITGGARFDASIGRDLYNLGFSVLEAYGLTESSGAATVTEPGEGGRGSVGRALPGVEVKIFPVEGRKTEVSRDGEIGIRGPIVMKGYFNRPEATAEIVKNGWLLTGDLGYLDANGRLTITGRKKEMIVLSTGKNIYPEEIEAHYAKSPFIQELCVIGMPVASESGVEHLHAVVVPNLEAMRARKVLNMGEILRFEIENLSVHLPSHLRVMSYEIRMESLPRTTTNKLKRFEIEREVQLRSSASEEGAAAAPMDTKDAIWAAAPQVARALVLVQEAARNKRAVRPDANLELDLGLDSIERVELMTNLEALFGTSIAEETAQNLFTVRQLIEAALPDESTGVSAGLPGDAWRKLLSDLPQEDSFFTDLLKPHRFFLLVVFVVLRIWSLLARMSLGFRVSGLDNLPRQGPYLLCPNHQTYLDPFLLVSALPFRTLRDVFFVGASEYFATSLRRMAARLMRLAPVDPDVNLVRAMQAGAYGLSHGKVLVLFPEGERSIDGEIKKFKKGAAILSTILTAPIVPVAIDGAFQVWPRNRPLQWSAFLPWKGTRIKICFGPTIPAPAAPAANASFAEIETGYAWHAERLRAVVARMQQEIRR